MYMQLSNLQYNSLAQKTGLCFENDLTVMLSQASLTDSWF